MHSPGQGDSGVGHSRKFLHSRDHFVQEHSHLRETLGLGLVGHSRETGGLGTPGVSGTPGSLGHSAAGSVGKARGWALQESLGFFCTPGTSGDSGVGRSRETLWLGDSGVGHPRSRQPGHSVRLGTPESRLWGWALQGDFGVFISLCIIYGRGSVEDDSKPHRSCH